jgi:transcription initiation factor TFIIB
MTAQIEKNPPSKFRARICPQCKSPRLIEQVEEGFRACSDCGFVISEETMFSSPKMKINTNRSLHTLPASASAKTQSAIIDHDSDQENLDNTLKKWTQVKTEDAQEKNLAIALQYITKIAIDISVPRIALEKACLVYKKIIEKKLCKGRSMRALVATAVIIGCKQCGIAITTKRVAHVSKISPRKITRFYRVVAEQINFAPQPSSASKYALDLSTKLLVSERTTNVLEKIGETLQHSKSFAGKDPTGTACAIIYISSILSGSKRTQREIAEAGRLTEQTIRARCRELEKNFVFNVSV